MKVQQWKIGLALIFLSASICGTDSAIIGKDSKLFSSDLVIGKRETGDSLVTRDSFVRKGQEKRIIAFRPYDVPRQYIITQVRVIDQTLGLGGIATYEYGGPGMDRVLIGFHSDAHQGINYKIELYAKLNK